MLNAEPRLAEARPVEAPSVGYHALLRVAFDALAMRMLRWVTLFMAFALFAAVLWQPHWIRFAAAASFTVLVFLPVLLKKEPTHASR